MLPVSIRMENFVCHGQSFLDFTKVKASLIVGEINGSVSDSNGSGKSTIFEAICWALYGECKASLIDRVIRDGENLCTVEFIFGAGDDIYRVIRRRRRDTSSDARLYVNDGDAWKEVSGNNVKSTNQKIVALVKFNYDTFTNSIFFRQKSLIDFAEKIPSEKLSLLKQLLYISEYDGYRKIAKESMSTIKAKLVYLQGQASSLQQDADKKANLEIQLAGLRSLGGVVEAELESMSDRRQGFLDRRAQLSSSLEKTQYLNSIIANYQTSKRSLDIKKQDYESYCRDISKIDIDGIKGSWHAEHEHYQKLNAQGMGFDATIFDNQALEISRQIGTLQGQVTEIKNSLVELSEAVGQCPLCESPLDEFRKVKVQSDKQSRILSFSDQMRSLGEQQRQTSITLDTHKQRESEMARIKAHLDSLQRQVEDYQFRLSNVASKRAAMEEATSMFNSLSEQYQAVSSSIDNTLSSEMASLQSEIQTLEYAITQKKNFATANKIQEGKVQQAIESCVAQQAKLMDVAEEINGTQKLLSVEEGVSNIFAEIPRLIINSALEEIELLTNQILSDISLLPMSVHIAPDTFSIDVAVHESVKSFDMLSVGQQTRVSIALRLALSQLLANRSGGQIRFLLLDEISSYLDDGAIEHLSYVITKLAEKFKILMISHDHRLREHFNSIIAVEMKNGVSTIKQ